MGGARRAEEEATERAAELLRNCVLPHATHQRPEPHAYLPACLPACGPALSCCLVGG